MPKIGIPSYGSSFSVTAVMLMFVPYCTPG